MILDHWGRKWDVESEEQTAFGFNIYRGRRSSGEDIQRRGGAAVIVTAELVAYLESRRDWPLLSVAKEIKISKTVLVTIRREIGLSRLADIAKWWTDRIDDLRSLTLEQFAEKHGVKTGAIQYWRSELVGKTFREPGWYLHPSALEALASDAPASTVASFLGGIAASSVGRLRSKLTAEGLIEREGTANELMARSKKGIPAHPNTKKALVRAARKKKSPEHRRHIAMANAEWHRNNPGAAVENFGLKAWTTEEETELGMASDREIAKRIGRTIAAVRSRRHQLKIPPFRPGWTMPVPRSDIGKKLCGLIRRRYESISGASRATGVSYGRLWYACEGRKAITDETLDSLLKDIHATRADLETS